MEENEIIKSQEEFFEVMKELCAVWNKHPDFMKQKSVRVVFELGTYLWDAPKYKGQKTEYKFLSSDVAEGTHLYYEHVVPVNEFLSYFKKHIQEMSFDEFSKLIVENCEVCGVSEKVKKQLKEFDDTMPKDWNFGDNKWQRYIDLGIEVKDSNGNAVRITR